MRNLKKILALVLALVMSLSLMATASAADTTAAGNPNYQTSATVLQKLGVVVGDAGTGAIRPTDSITRAEVAALLYRIATGDVTDTQANIHTGQPFTDVNANDWYTGYISYCYIAEIIKGNPNGSFEPNKDINGYATLAMILRAMGYGKKGEFVGDGWEIRTASTAQQIGILNGINDTQLSGPAARELVFEILFRAILKDTVRYNALHEDYEPTGESLGKQQFGLEEVTGVVMANEWANLEGDSVIAADTTVMKVDGKNITVDEGTDLDAVGQTYNAYIANGEGGTKRALTLVESDINDVYFNEGAAVPDVTKKGNITADTEYYLNYTQAWEEDCTSEYLIRYRVTLATEKNLGPLGQGVYQVIVDSDVYKYLTETKSVSYENTNGYYNDTPTSGLSTSTYDEVAGTPNAWGFAVGGYPAPVNKEQKPLVAVRTIRPGDPITKMDRDIMQEIFYSADRNGENTTTDVVGYIDGEVYVGTSSRVDVSDTMSWKNFQKEYLIDSKETYKFDSCVNGESLRVIDNDGDGKAEYALKITYTLDKAIGTYKDNLEFYNVRVSSYDDTSIPDDLTVGDVVVWNVIDGKLTMWKADVLTDSVKTKSFKDTTITTTGGETKGQSGITNATEMDELILNMNDVVEYNMYLDRFGYVRAYELAQGSKYALLTEIYPTNMNNGAYITNTDVIAEVKIEDADVANYRIANATSRNWSPFISDSVWTSDTNHFRYTLPNYLQPAIAHLDLDSELYTGATGGLNYRTWNRNVYQMVPQATTGSYGVFDYGAVPNTWYGENSLVDPAVDHSFSFTNVAAYVLDGDDIILNTASKLFTDKNGEQVYYGAKLNGTTWVSNFGSKWTQSSWIAYWLEAGTSLDADDLADWFVDLVRGTDVTGLNPDKARFYPVYAVDYVQLTKQDVSSGTRHLTIDPSYSTKYHINSNGYVDANKDTVFYIVMPNGISFVSSYDDLPSIKGANVRAAYAVATNTAEASDSLDYWVADVVVLEVDGLYYSYDSISLMYFNPFETSGSVRYINSLNNQWRTLQPDYDGLAKMDVVPERVTDATGASTTWGNSSWRSTAYGFYELYQTELETEGTLSAVDVVRIVKDYNDHGIYAGTVARMNKLVDSGFIDIDTLGRASQTDAYNDEFVKRVDIRYDYDVPVYRVTANSAGELRLTERNGDVEVGDPVIYVYNMAQNKVAFMVDLKTTYKSNGDVDYSAPTWLRDEYRAIILEQENAGDDGVQIDVSFGMYGDKDLEITNVTGAEFGKYQYTTGGVTYTFNDEYLADGETENPAYHLGYFYYPAGTQMIKFTVKTSNAQTIGAIRFTDGWEVIKVETLSATETRVTLFNDGQTASAQTLSASGEPDASAASTDKAIDGAKVNDITETWDKNILATQQYVTGALVYYKTYFADTYAAVVAAGENGAWDEVLWGQSDWVTCGLAAWILGLDYDGIVMYLGNDLDDCLADLKVFLEGTQIAGNDVAEAAVLAAIDEIKVALGQKEPTDPEPTEDDFAQALIDAYNKYLKTPVTPADAKAAAKEALYAAAVAYKPYYVAPTTPADATDAQTAYGETVKLANADVTGAKTALDAIDAEHLDSLTKIAAALEAVETYEKVSENAWTLTDTAAATIKAIKDKYEAVVGAVEDLKYLVNLANALINAYDAYEKADDLGVIGSELKDAKDAYEAAWTAVNDLAPADVKAIITNDNTYTISGSTSTTTPKVAFDSMDFGPALEAARQDALDALDEYWSNVPANVQENEAVATAYAALLTALTNAEDMPALATAANESGTLWTALTDAVDKLTTKLPNADPETGVITLVNDINLAETVTYNNEDVVIDLNGNTLTGPDDNDPDGAVIIVTGGSLEISNGTIDAGAVVDGEKVQFAGNAIDMNGNAHVLLTDVNIVGSMGDYPEEGVSTSAAIRIDANCPATASVTMIGGSISDCDFGVTTNGNGANAVVVVLEDVEIDTAFAGIYLGGNGSVTATGCTITGHVEQGVEVHAGTLKLIDCEVSGLGMPYGPTDSADKGIAGTDVKGPALVVRPKGNSGANIDVTVSGGKLISSDTTAVDVGGTLNGKTVTVEILGVTIETTRGTPAKVVNTCVGATVTVDGEEIPKKKED